MLAAEVTVTSRAHMCSILGRRGCRSDGCLGRRCSCTTHSQSARFRSRRSRTCSSCGKGAWSGGAGRADPRSHAPRRARDEQRHERRHRMRSTCGLIQSRRRHSSRSIGAPCSELSACCSSWRTHHQKRPWRRCRCRCTPQMTQTQPACLTRRPTAPVGRRSLRRRPDPVGRRGSRRQGC